MWPVRDGSEDVCLQCGRRLAMPAPGAPTTRFERLARFGLTGRPILAPRSV